MFFCIKMVSRQISLTLTTHRLNSVHKLHNLILYSFNELLKDKGY